MTHAFSPVALVVIDIQAPFLKACANSENIIRRTSFAIKAARLLDLEIIVTEQVPDKLGPTLLELLEAAGEPTTFSKTAFSAMRAEGFSEYLQDKGIHHLLLTGIETPICLYQTTIDALAEDMLDVTLLSDCITARKPADAAVALQALTEGGAHCLPSETVFYSMLGDATHPRFKDFTTLVKEYT